MTARSLAEALRAAGDDELAALLAARPELLVPVPVDMSQLAYRAASSPAVARALDRLDRWRLQVLEAACLRRSGHQAGLQRCSSRRRAAAVDAALDDLLTAGAAVGRRRGAQPGRRRP